MTSTASDPSGPARSAPDAHTAPLQAQQLPPDEDLIERADRCIAAALEGGALQPIRTEQDWLEEAGLRFSVRWVSSLALKDRARVDTVTRKRADFNPFLPPEAALTVAELGAYHRLVLNKFPVIERHLLVVTRDFEDQSEPLDAADLGALGAIMAAHGGLGFYNGGPVAGASQRHKHLQWVPASASRLGSFVPAPTTAHANAPGTVFDNPLLPWAHAFVRLDAALWNEPATLGATLHAAFARACAALELQPTAQPMPPYNLLLTREVLLLVPRTQEKWLDVSINSLAYAGSLFVRDRAQIEALRSVGPLAVLAAVGRAR